MVGLFEIAEAESLGYCDGIQTIGLPFLGKGFLEVSDLSGIDPIEDKRKLLDKGALSQVFKQMPVVHRGGFGTHQKFLNIVFFEKGTKL